MNLPDRIHPNLQGHQMICQMLAHLIKHLPKISRESNFKVNRVCKAYQQGNHRVEVLEHLSMSADAGENCHSWTEWLGNPLCSPSLPGG